MGAKDTLLDIHIRQELVVDWVCNPFNDTPIELIKNTILNTAQIQAEISFKAGIKEVVEWINKHKGAIFSMVYYGKDTTRITFEIDSKDWQAKLKEWGVRPV